MLLAASVVAVLASLVAAYFGLRLRRALRDLARRSASVEEHGRAAPHHALQDVIDAVPAMINAKDLDSRYMFMNRFQADLYGTTPEGAIGKTAGELLAQEYGKYTGSRDRIVIETGQPLPYYEEQYPDAQGEDRAWLTTKVPTFGTDGKVNSIITVAFDITEQRRTQLALLQAQAETEAAMAARTGFMANMSHELRTPLNAIVGFAEFMAKEPFGPFPSPKYAEYIEHIRSSGAALDEMVASILDLTSIESGSHSLDESIVCVTNVIADALRASQRPAEQRRVAILSALSSELPGLRGDARALHTILVNLLSNAIKFSHPGGRVTVTARVDGSGDLLLAVTDSGIGMEPSQVPLALEPFRRLEGHLVRRYDGAGLGLPTAKALTALHGGNLTVDSEIDRGTTVTVRLPARRVAAGHQLSLAG
jgi:PAS domain S-box-containing protein